MRSSKGGLSPSVLGVRIGWLCNQFSIKNFPQRLASRVKTRDEMGIREQTTLKGMAMPPPSSLLLRFPAMAIGIRKLYTNDWTRQRNGILSNTLIKSDTVPPQHHHWSAPITSSVQKSNFYTCPNCCWSLRIVTAAPTAVQMNFYFVLSPFPPLLIAFNHPRHPWLQFNSCTH